MKKILVYFLILVFIFTANPFPAFAYQGAGKKGTANTGKTIPENDDPDALPPIPDDQIIQTPVQTKKALSAPRSGNIYYNPIIPKDLCEIAKKDAQADKGNSWWFWAGMGCLGTFSGSILGIAAVVWGYMISSPVPVNRIMGKPHDYVLLYTSCYQEETRSENGGAALIGCVAPYVALLVGGLIYLAYTNQL